MPDLPIDAVCSFTKSPRSSHCRRLAPLVFRALRFLAHLHRARGVFARDVSGLILRPETRRTSTIPNQVLTTTSCQKTRVVDATAVGSTSSIFMVLLEGSSSKMVYCFRHDITFFFFFGDVSFHFFATSFFAFFADEDDASSSSYAADFNKAEISFALRSRFARLPRLVRHNRRCRFLRDVRRGFSTATAVPSRLPIIRHIGHAVLRVRRVSKTQISLRCRIYTAIGISASDFFHLTHLRTRTPTFTSVINLPNLLIILLDRTVVSARPRGNTRRASLSRCSLLLLLLLLLFHHSERRDASFLASTPSTRPPPPNDEWCHRSSAEDAIDIITIRG